MEYNCRLYSYPSGNHVTFFKKTVTRKEKDIDNVTVKKENTHFTKSHVDENRTQEAEAHSKNVSLSASKNRIYNIARSNTWQWFITLTFDRNNNDSSDYEIVTRRLKTFLNHLQQRKCPDMKYLIVPELHADKEHYHFHGLLSNVDNLRFCFSGKFDKKENPIFNILDWTYGFTTATQVKDTNRASSYITKYVTKDIDLKLKNKKRYLCSRNIDRTEPEFMMMYEEDFLEVYADDIAYAKNVKVAAAHQSINYYELKD